MAKALGSHPDWVDARWFVAGRDADEWEDTVERMDKEGKVYTRKFVSAHDPGYTYTFDPSIAEDWYLDASTVQLIQNHANNMNQLARLNKHNWWG